MSTAISPPALRSQVDQPSSELGSPNGKSGLYNGFGPLLRRLHFYTGILVAPFLFLVALTGLAYAFAPQADEVAYHDQLHVATTGSARIPLSQQVSAAQQVVSGGTLVAIHPADEPDATTKVEFSLPELGDSQRTVYIDPYSGHVRGVLTTKAGDTPITVWLGEMHSSLHLGEPGRLYSELAASWLWVLVLGGIILWWRHQRGKHSARRLLLPETAARQGVRRSRSWHAAIGVWIGVVLLFLSATGLTWSQYAGANFDLLRASLNSDSIPLKTTLDGSGPTGGEEHHGTGHTVGGTANFDAIHTAITNAGLTGPVTITPAKKPDLAWTVAQIDNTWPVRRDKVAVHPGTGQIVDTVRWADQPLLSQLTSLGIQAHMGVLFGLANQLVLAVVALGLITSIVYGYRMWWQRRPTRDGRRATMGAPPTRGTWRQLPKPVLIIIGIVVIAIGWAVPLLGWTLLAFVIFDALVGMARRRRALR